MTKKQNRKYGKYYKLKKEHKYDEIHGKKE